MEAVAAEAVFATAAEAVVADTMIMAAAATEGLAAGGGLLTSVAGEAIGADAAAGLIESGATGVEGAAMEAASLGAGAQLIESGATGLEGALREGTALGPQGAPGTAAAPGADVIGGGPKTIPMETQPKKGSVLDWLKNNKTAATVGGQLVAGALQGAGAAMGAKNAAKIKAESDRALLQQQTDEKMRLSREGTYTGKAGPVPSGNPILRRLSNGQLVYVNGSGIIGNRIA